MLSMAVTLRSHDVGVSCSRLAGAACHRSSRWHPSRLRSPAYLQVSSPMFARQYFADPSQLASIEELK